MNQNFSVNELLSYLSMADLKEHKMDLDDLKNSLEYAAEAIIKGTFEFDISNRKSFYYCASLIDILILRKLKDNIGRIYKDEQANRRVIISQITTMLPDACPFWVLRTDISKFYESINRDRVYSKLQNDARLSYYSLWLIKTLFEHKIISTGSGLPKGIGISATLSEIYMRKFDRYIRGCRGVYYYARFVDDILIFSNHEESLQQISNHMEENLEEGLQQNKSKTAIYNGAQILESHPLEYLGYKFTIAAFKGNKKTVTIAIARRKIKKIKTRLVLSFATFSKDADFIMLQKRIKFLTGNYSIRSAHEHSHDLKAGIYYNYLYINDFSQLDDLNDFYHRLLHAANGSLGSILAIKLSPSNKALLSKYSFKQGFKQKIYHKFSFAEMKTIKKAWMYE